MIKTHWWMVCVVLLATTLGKAQAAEELTVDPEDLPRIPAVEPGDALETFEIKPGFRIELAAAEPLVKDPVAVSFDARGRLYVVEMRGYSERRQAQIGRVRRLVDTDEDGRFDQSSVYVDDLAWPTAVFCYQGGIFVGATPDILYCKDTDGDGAADLREVVFSGFGSTTDRLNVQQLLNNFTWGLDNRIHGASGGNGGRITSSAHPDQPPVDVRRRDFSFDPRTRRMRVESGGGQFGLSFDNRGRKFVCNNSRHIRVVRYARRYADLNPFYSLPNVLEDIPVDGSAAPVYRISPDEPWRVIRTRWRVAGKVGGPIEGGGTPSGYFTAATGIVIYRGNAWPEDYRGNAFIADCGSNLVHRKRLIQKGAGVIARRPESEQKTEFLASRDNWFRPVQLANGPDGALYVIDMYREVIEHPWSLPEPIKKHLDLNNGNDRGRIYRIVPDDFESSPPPRLAEATTPELVEHLAHSNGWHRDTAARLLYERRDDGAVPHLEEMLRSSSSEWGRLHALAVLDGMDRLSDSHLLNALSDSAGPVREHALRLVEKRRVQPDEILPAKWWKQLSALAEDPDPQVRYQLALTLGFVRHPDKATSIAGMLRRDAGDPWMRSALLNSLARESVAVLNRLIEQKAFQQEPIDRHVLPVLLRITGARNQGEEVNTVLDRLVRIEPASRVFPYLQAVGEGLQEAGSSLAQTVDADPLNQFFELARQTASNSSASNKARQQALQLLSQAPWERAEEVLFSLLDPDTPEVVQAAAIDGLNQFAAPGIGPSLIERWDYLTPRLRGKAVEVLLRRPERVKALLDALKGETIVPAELSAAQKEFLRRHNEPPLQQRAKAILGESTPAGHRETNEAFAEALKLTGRPAQGKAIYEQRCASCHHLGDAGFNVGPDLATMKSSGKETLLTHILHPNRDVAPEYVNYQVVTTDGETLTGLISQETGSRLTLKNANGQITEIQRNRIERIRSLGQSLMPEGLAQGLSPQELADLLAFVLGS